MSLRLKIKRVREFINQESAYMLMLSFIILFNALVIFAEKVPEVKEEVVAERILESQPSEEALQRGLPPKMSREEALGKILKNKALIYFVNTLVFLALAVFCLGLFLDIRILMARIRRREMFPEPAEHAAIAWGLWDVARLTIIFVFFSYILHIAGGLILSLISTEEKAPLFMPLLNTGIMDLAILGLIIYFVKVKYGQAISAIGLKVKNAARLALLALLGYVAFLPILVFLLIMIILITTLLNYQPQQHILHDFFLEEQRFWPLFFSIFMVVALGPIVEEIFFRGFAYNAIKKRWGAPKACVLISVVFAGLHANLIGFLPIFALGLLLVYMYEKTGSLIPSITIHILHNSMMMLMLFLGRNLLQLAQ
jgi:membrane protease YdiL (CAAX protease family)